MTKKGYGNLRPRFAKYFARHKNSAGPHDPKNAKQQALDKEAKMHIQDVIDDPKVGSTAGWAFVGFIGKEHAVGNGAHTKSVPLGTFTKFCDGRTFANAWISNTPDGCCWEAMPIHEELDNE